MWFWPQIRKIQLKISMGDFYMNRAYNKWARLKIAKKVSNFEDHAENFYSNKTFRFYNMGFHSIYSKIVTLQRNTPFVTAYPVTTSHDQTVKSQDYKWNAVTCQTGKFLNLSKGNSWHAVTFKFLKLISLNKINLKI
jgi:hypothetical protein